VAISRQRADSARRVAGFLVLATVALGGCYHGTAHNVSPDELHAKAGWEMIDGMKMVRQSSARDCGAAALAMMLERWGTPGPTTADVLRDVSFDAQQGIAAGALRDLARQRGLVAFLIPGQLEDLMHEIHLRRPVLVGLVQQYGDKAYAHYEVVVGINARNRRLLLFDPARGPREDGFDGFSTEWKGAKQLALVVTGKVQTAPEATPAATTEAAR
jgi:ABC-type bacteriocin/lantibiotic exporter with double-glycine peptidase domain